ncbi:MAG: NAD(+)/NADH kinase [Thermoanaerobaculia bacterium]
MPSPPSDSLLSPCVLVVKTPIVSRKGMAGRLVHTGERLAGQVEDAAREQELTLTAVQEALAGLGVTPTVISADVFAAPARRALARARFVITVGGDGTLLATSHWVTRAALLGVNSAPKSSVGYLTSTRATSVARDLARIARGDLLPQAVARVEVEIGGKKLPPALNDVLVAHEQPAATSRYRVRLGRRAEDHRSSGLWVSTPTGSTAGIRSAGGQPMRLSERRLQLRARELYRVKGRSVALESGFVKDGQELEIESAMQAGWLFVDGARMATHFPFGAVATFRVAEEPLLLFADPGRWTAA